MRFDFEPTQRCWLVNGCIILGSERGGWGRWKVSSYSMLIRAAPKWLEAKSNIINYKSNMALELHELLAG